MIGKTLKYLRRKRGERLQDVADRIGVSAATVSRWENGERTPNDHYVRDIAEAFDMSVEDLWELDEEVSPDQAPPTPTQAERDGAIVTSKSQLSDWRDEVARDTSMTHEQRLLLLYLPVYIDRTSWVAAITLEDLKRDTGLNDELLEEHWPWALETEYAERVGNNQWTFRLKFPEG